MSPSGHLLPATAVAHGLVVLTRHEKDRERCGAWLCNPQAGGSLALEPSAVLDYHGYDV